MANVTYSRVNWEDSPSTDTPINATNLNKMDAGISQVDTRANESMPYANILDDWTDISAVTTPNTYTADAMRVAELNTNLNWYITNGVLPPIGTYFVNGIQTIIMKPDGIIYYLLCILKRNPGRQETIGHVQCKHIQ